MEVYVNLFTALTLRHLVQQCVLYETSLTRIEDLRAPGLFSQLCTERIAVLYRRRYRRAPSRDIRRHLGAVDPCSWSAHTLWFP